MLVSKFCFHPACAGTLIKQVNSYFNTLFVSNYCELNEEADINVRQEVEDVFESNFHRKAAYEQRIQLEWEDMDKTETSYYKSEN